MTVNIDVCKVLDTVLHGVFPKSFRLQVLEGVDGVVRTGRMARQSLH